MKNADLPAMPVVNGDNEPAEFDRPFYRNSNLATGLTKLEAFTKAAMQGLLAGGYCVSDGNGRYRLKDVPAEAVNIARAVLDELEKQNDQ